jgi:hypothetical protein
MSQRILISASRVAVSRPGYDVIGSPSSPDYMAIDSNFSKSVRLIKAGSVGGAPDSNTSVYYSQTYSAPPFVEIYQYNSFAGKGFTGPAYATPIRLRTNYGSVQYTANPIYINLYTDHFTFTYSLHGSTDYLGATTSARNWTYFVYEPN